MHYVMSDIHGCYYEFIQMLDKIGYDYNDKLYLLGDYIDRGAQSYEMVEWIKQNQHNNIVYLRGNHEEEFIANIDLLNQIDISKPLLDVCEELHKVSMYFDTYGTIRGLIKDNEFDLEKLNEWKQLFESMKYTQMVHIRGCKPTYILVHAGYISSVEGLDYESREEFYLYARPDDAYNIGGHKGNIIVAGHTPTIIESELTYKDGKIFHLYNRNNRCIYYNIDCGCVFRDKYPNAQLACLRLDDGEYFYV